MVTALHGAMSLQIARERESLMSVCTLPADARVADFLRFMANGNLLGIPMPFVLLIIISLITWVVLHRSVYGRYLFATGRNAEAARYAGIDTNRIITITYVI